MNSFLINKKNKIQEQDSCEGRNLVLNLFLKKTITPIFLLLFIFMQSTLFTQEIDDDTVIKLKESNEYSVLDLRNYDIDDISNITSSNDKIFINFTSDKTILSYDEVGSFIQENDISNSLAVSIVINSVRTNKYDSYLYFFHTFNDLNFYAFDNMNNIVYNYDNEFNIKTKRKLFVEEQFEIEPVKLSNKFYTPSYNSLLFLDNYSNQFYLVENGGYTKNLQLNYEVKEFYFDISSQQFYIYNSLKKQIDIYTLRGIFIKTIKNLDKILQDNRFRKIITANKNEIIIQTQKDIFSLKLNANKKEIIKNQPWEKVVLPKTKKLETKEILNIFNINIKNKNKLIIKTENQVILYN